MNTNEFPNSRLDASLGSPDRISGRVRLSGNLILALAIVMAALCLPSTASAAECTNTWTGAAEGSWATAASWSAKHVPTSTEVACIGAGKTVNITSGSRQVKMLQGEGTLTIAEGSLKITATAEASSIKNLTLDSSGILTGAATLKVSKSLLWTSGKMTGTGSTVLLSGSTATVDGVNLSERTLVNEGTLTFPESYFEITKGATIKNVGTFNANSEGVSGITTGGEGSGKIVNTGLFHKTTGSGISIVHVDFENKATVNGESGTLEFLNSTITLASSSTLKGTSYFRGSTITGANFTAPSGTVTLWETSVTIESGKTAKIANLTGEFEGRISGAGTLEVSNSLSWGSQDRMTGTGSTILKSGGTGNLEEGARLYERTLVNEGTMTYAFGFIEMYDGATFENAGTFNANSENISGIVVEGEGAAPRIVNTGTFRKTSGEETTRVGVEFDNQGTVHTASGQLRFSDGGLSTGGEWSADEGGLIGFTGESPFGFIGGVLSGEIEVINGSVTEEGLETTNLSLTVTAPKSPNLASFSVEKGTLDAKNLSLTDYGVLANAGTVEVSNSLTIEAGWLTGTGSTILKSGGTGNLEEGARLYGSTLVNEGTMTYAFGFIEMYDGATFENAGTFNANSENISGIVVEGEGAAPRIVNTGTFRKTSGEETTRVGVEFDNQGTVHTASGQLRFSDGGLSTGGEWSADEGGLIGFTGESPFGFIGGVLSGEIEVINGSVTEEGLETTNLSLTVTAPKSPNLASFSVEKGTLDAKNLSLTDYGVLANAGTVEVSNSLTIEAGWLTGTGSTILKSGGTGNLEEGARLYGSTLVNEGTMTYAFGFIEMYDGATFENAGTFNANSENISGIVVEGEGAAPRIVNTGTFRKTSGEETTRVGVEFDNQGQIDEGPGHIKIEHPVAARASEHFSKECKTADPVNCATGDYSESQTDLVIGGLGVGLNLTRTYSAQAAATAGSPGVFGYGWTASFSDHLVSAEEGKEITLFSSDGGTVPFSKTGESSFQAPSWSQDTLSGSSEAGYTLITPEQIEYAFSGSGRLEGVTDRNGNETTLSYIEGRLSAITDPAGRQITLTYNGSGQVESADDPIGYVVKYDYEGGDLTSVTMPGETEPRWRFKYDGSHRITQVTDGRGGKTNNEYDGSSRVVSQTGPAERTTTFEYASFHTVITDQATGSVTDERFTSNHEPFSITHGYGTPEASTETFSYNAAGLLTGCTDGNGHKTTYTYDAHGNRTSETNAVEDETKWTYDEAHQVLTETKPSGEKTTITRDANGNPETVSRPAPESKTQTVSYEYGPHGETKSMTDPLGHVWSYEYDSHGDLKAEIDPQGDKRTWAYDEDSRVASTVSPRGNEEGAEAAKFTTSIERDLQGRALKVTDPLEGTTKYAYDADGNVESITDSNGRKTKFTYDADNEQTKVERPNGGIEETGYDGAGMVTSQTDGNKHKTTYVRNVLEEPVEVIDPLERKTTKTFDAVGNLKTKVDPDGRTTTYGYDNANRLKEISYSDKITPNVSIGYDKNGHLTSMVDGTGESSFEYDQLDRLIHSKDGNGDTVSWEYNLADEPVGLTYPNGKSISRAYDKAGRLQSVTDWLGHTTSFAYNKDSELRTTTFPEGTGDSDEYAFDRAGRMSAVTIKKGAETLASLSYARDKAGQVESLISKGLPGAEEESFAYDENERLTKAGAAEFGYDAANNITKAPGTTNAFDKASQLESAAGATFTYDKEGERTKRTPSSGPATTYKYDQAGNLTAVERPEEGETPAIAESFAYNGTGLLASRTVGLSTRHLVWDLTESPGSLLSDGEGGYVFGPNGLAVEQISSGEEPTYIHHDQLGSTRVLTNNSGEPAATFTYGSYGGLTAKTGAATTALGYAGEYTLGQSGLQYLRARFYDSTTAQFLTRDPGVEVTQQPYAYAGDDSLTLYDRTGQACEEPVNFGGFIHSVIPNPIDCFAEGAKEIAESPVTGPAIAVGCGVLPGCPEAGGLVAGIAAITAGNLLHSESDPCFEFGPTEVGSVIATVGAALPGLVVEAGLDAAAGSAGVPAAVRVVTNLPGWILEAVHSAAGH